MRKLLHRVCGFIAAAIVATASAGVQAEGATPPMPEVKWNMTRALFPSSERRNKKEGTVGVEFSIDAKGIPRDITVTKAASKAFDSSATRVIRTARFAVTDAWIAAGGPDTRYQMSIEFGIAPCDSPPANGSNSNVILICSHRLTT